MEQQTRTELFGMDRPMFEAIDPYHTHTVVFVISRCHKYAGGWIPEPESPAALREEGIDRTPTGPRKRHWIDAPCSHVRGPHAWKLTHLHLDGEQFDRTVHTDRCQTCARYFAEA